MKRSIIVIVVTGLAILLLIGVFGVTQGEQKKRDPFFASAAII